ncbi:major facilitator superfamily transporter [Stemphylium lycopersici]|nr:major facilitator superfamily transporter [Stemphylium lycopersici]
MSTDDGAMQFAYCSMSKQVNRKMDIALLPFLSLLYLFNGLDRSNVGNAETQGFTTDIGATPDDLNLAVSLFFITFIGWGLFTLAHAFIHGRNALIGVRLMIGAFEAGFYPTAVAYLSTFYSRYDLAVRIGLFYGQYAVAGAFSGSIAFGIFHLNGTTLYNWQYLFIIEGTLTILIAFVAWFWLPHGPGTAWFLSADEQVFASQRVAKDHAAYVLHYGHDGLPRKRLTQRDAVETFKDWKLWFLLMFNICASVPSQAFSVFMPMVVQGLGYSSVEANLMSVPPFVCGAAGLYLFALSSDRRALHPPLWQLCISASDRSLAQWKQSWYVTNEPSIVHISHFAFQVLTKRSEPGKRFLVMGVNGFGNLAGVIGSQLYKKQYAPRYLIPFYATLGFVAAALVGYAAYKYILKRVNERKLKLMEGKSEEQIEAERLDETRYADAKWTFLYGFHMLPSTELNPLNRVVQKVRPDNPIAMFQFSSLVPNPFASRSTPRQQPSGPPPPPTVAEDPEAPLAPPFPFLRLPLELREQIYSHYFDPADHLAKSPVHESKGFFGGIYEWDFDIFLANKQVYRESKKVWRREIVFVKIATPWPSAVNHISSEGLVPIVCHDAKATAFTEHHAVVQISAPFHGVVPEHMVVVLVDDLHLFTKTWYYSALSYPMLNERLSTTFVLRNPSREEHDSDDEAEQHREEEEEEEEEEEGLGVPIALQKKLLLPFEHVKGLHGTRIHGYSRSVQSELARLQALPIPSLQQSLESATDFMLAGDAALATPDAEDTAALEALELYNKAFHAIHILIHGRTRRVMADVFFHESITQGRYAGQTGITVRVILRLKLVSRTIAAYNKLAKWDEAAYWGMRSIHILHESLNPDFEAFLTEVLGGADVGLIYLRTGIAFWQMESQRMNWLGELIHYADEAMAQSESLWKTSRRFLRDLPRGHVRAELVQYGVPRETVALFADVKKEDAVQSSVVADGESSSTSEE